MESQMKTSEPKMGQAEPNEPSASISPEFTDLILSELKNIVNKITDAEKKEHADPLQTTNSDGKQEETNEKADQNSDDEAMNAIEISPKDVPFEDGDNRNKFKEVIKECLEKLARIFYPKMPPDVERCFKGEKAELTTEGDPIIEQPKEFERATSQDKGEKDSKTSDSKTIQGIKPQCENESLVENLYKELISEAEEAKQFHFNENLKLLLKCMLIVTEAIHPYLAELREKSQKTSPDEEKGLNDGNNETKPTSLEKAKELNEKGEENLEESSVLPDVEPISGDETEDAEVPAANEKADKHPPKAAESDKVPNEKPLKKGTTSPPRADRKNDPDYKPPLESLLFLIEHFYPEYSSNLDALFSDDKE